VGHRIPEYSSDSSALAHIVGGWGSTRLRCDSHQVAAERKGKVLLELVRHNLGCCQRLTHIHDETERGRPLRSLDELRRMVFVTSAVCYELAALAVDAAT
jgi:hypothetical protein